MYKIYVKIAQWLISAGWWFYHKAIKAAPIACGTSEDLDRVGAAYGVDRREGESNESLRQRIMEQLQRPGGAGNAE